MAPLTPPCEAPMGLLGKTFGLPTDEIPKTYAQAYELLQRPGKGLFQ
jgi:phospholipase C